MNDEALPPGGLDAKGGPRRPRWGRRTPYGLRRDDEGRDDRREPVHGHAGVTYAALDLGTNNCRLLVARPTADGFRVVDAFSRIIRLGEGVAASRRISEAAISRAVEALLVCRDKMRGRGVTRARLIATEACRAADNGEEFRKRVAKEAGLQLETIDVATEARLAATGCTELFDPAALSYRWRHPDPQMDELCADLQKLVALGDRLGASRGDLFGMIWERAFGTKTDFEIERRSPVPHLTEAWYCCAEPVLQPDEDPFAVV